MNLNEYINKINNNSDKRKVKSKMISKSFLGNTAYLVSSVYEYGIDYIDIQGSFFDINNLSAIVSDDIFNYPYYIKFHINEMDDEIISLINSIDKEVPIYISGNIEKDKLKSLNRGNILVGINEWISIDEFFAISNMLEIDIESSPVIIIDKIDEYTLDKLLFSCKVNPNLRFRIEVKNKEFLMQLKPIIEAITDEEPLIVLPDDIFNNFNDNNMREMVINPLPFLEQMQDLNKPVKIHYLDSTFYSFNALLELERNLGILKSRIPNNASELDKIVFTSLFISNYFSYDFDLLEQTDSHKRDRTIDEFMTLKKGVCRHFAKFTKYILNSIGVNCNCISGLGDTAEGHEFNIVTIQGKNYFLDNTWLSQDLKFENIMNISQSLNFLTSNQEFGHEEYLEYQDYHCDTYNRNEIDESMKRVSKWKYCYYIHADALRDLFRKKTIKERNMEKEVVNAMPGMRG